MRYCKHHYRNCHALNETWNTGNLVLFVKERGTAHDYNGKAMVSRVIVQELWQGTNLPNGIFDWRYLLMQRGAAGHAPAPHPTIQGIARKFHRCCLQSHLFNTFFTFGGRFRLSGGVVSTSRPTSGRPSPTFLTLQNGSPQLASDQLDGCIRVLINVADGCPIRASQEI